MTRHLIAVVLIGLFASVSASDPDTTIGEKPFVPLDLVRAFYVAMLSNDEAAISKIILPSPDAKILWQGTPPPAEMIAQIKTMFDKMTCTECAVGETINLPGGRELKVTDQMVNENRKMVIPATEGKPFPIPVTLVKIDGEWKVDAGAFIAARLAGKRAMEKGRNQAGPQ